jgi:hypothetical protein
MDDIRIIGFNAAFRKKFLFIAKRGTQRQLTG